MARDAATFGIDFKLKIARRDGNRYPFRGAPFGDLPSERRLDLLAERDDALLFLLGPETPSQARVVCLDCLDEVLPGCGGKRQHFSAAVLSVSDKYCYFTAGDFDAVTVF